MQFARAKSLLVLVAAGLVAAGCGGGGGGGGGVSAQDRIDGCLQKQPDATEAECTQWEKEGQLADDGTHQGHENK